MHLRFELRHTVTRHTLDERNETHKRTSEGGENRGIDTSIVGCWCDSRWGGGLDRAETLRNCLLAGLDEGSWLVDGWDGAGDGLGGGVLDVLGDGVADDGGGVRGHGLDGGHIVGLGDGHDVGLRHGEGLRHDDRVGLGDRDDDGGTGGDGSLEGHRASGRGDH
ncbi:hypothetical protein V491_03647, partial [Pseudogymnoascus sp. VKM F-3775]